MYARAIKYTAESVVSLVMVSYREVTMRWKRPWGVLLTVDTEASTAPWSTRTKTPLVRPSPRKSARGSWRGRTCSSLPRYVQGVRKQTRVHFMSTGVYSFFLSEEIRITYINLNGFLGLFKLWDTHHNPANIRENFFKSLNKLKCGYVDLYLIHWPFGFEVKLKKKEN